MRNILLDAVYKHAEGHIAKHRANVEVYLHQPVGIGEHSDIMEAIEIELEQIAKYTSENGVEEDIVIPPKERSDKDSKYAGAYVKEPIPGKYDWVVSFDLNSLYPHLIMQYNISPETLLDERHPSVTVDKILNQEITFELYKDKAVCANGAMFRKDVRGFLPELMEKIYKDRTIYKKKMLAAKQEYEKKKTKELEKEIARCNNIQMARKIQLNSAYGAIGNQYFRYYKLANAEAITLSGQVSIRWIENKVNAYINKILKTDGVDYVIASDTDSIYLNMGPLVKTVYQGRETTNEKVVSFLDKLCKIICITLLSSHRLS